jgi:hypothetical protein
MHLFSLSSFSALFQVVPALFHGPVPLVLATSVVARALD